MVGQQQHLTAPVAAAFPPLLAGVQVDAGQHPVIEPVCRAAVDHEVVEGRLQKSRNPPLLFAPRSAVVRDIDQGRADACPGVKENFVGGDDPRLD